MRLIKSQYRLIAKEDLIELLADLTSKYSNLDLKTGSHQEITRLKSEINLIQKEILSRQDNTPGRNHESNPSPPKG
jgi:hypothetical protein